MVIFAVLLGYAVGYDGTNGAGLMAKEPAQTIQCRGLHFEVGNAVIPEVKIGQLLIKIFYPRAKA